jgi:tetrahydromethanopterin S-methyltransferase subunit E
VTDTSTRPARAAATRWDRPALQTFGELLLGLSFVAAVAFGGYASVTGQLAVVSQGAAVVFLVTLTLVLVSWFRAVEREERSERIVVSPLAAIDAEYRR